MRIEFGLCLPRDETSVPFVRHLCRAALDRMGVEQECADDIEVAASEACTNVLRHVTSHEYEVRIEIDDDVCTVRIIDTGEGFDAGSLIDSHWGAEGGRGIHLMRHLVDDLNFTSGPTSGTVVELRKSLALRSSSMVRVMGRNKARSE